MTDNTTKPSMQPEDERPKPNSVDSNTERQLRLDDIEISGHLTRKQILDKWGPPDLIAGSGIEYLVYKLKDGRYLKLGFHSPHPQSLLKAFVNEVGKTKDKVLFDGMGDPFPIPDP